ILWGLLNATAEAVPLQSPRSNSTVSLPAAQGVGEPRDQIIALTRSRAITAIRKHTTEGTGSFGWGHGVNAWKKGAEVLLTYVERFIGRTAYCNSLTEQQFRSRISFGPKSHLTKWRDSQCLTYTMTAATHW